MEVCFGAIPLSMDTVSFLKFRMIACAGHGSVKHGMSFDNMRYWAGNGTSEIQK